MSNIIRLNRYVLNSYNKKMQNEQSNFNSKTFSTFKASYLFSCSDNTVIKMRQNLQKKYNNIQTMYKKVNDYFNNYLKDCENIENSLSSNGKMAIEGSIQTELNKLVELKAPKFNIKKFVYNDISSQVNFSNSNAKDLKLKTSYTASEVDVIINSYKEQKSKELDEYNLILINTQNELNELESLRVSFSELSKEYNDLKISADNQAIEKASNYKIYCSEEKLKELGLSSKELQNISIEDLLKICQEKDSEVKAIYSAAETVKAEILDKKVQEMTKFDSYSSYEAYIKNLKSDEIILKSTIRKTKQLCNTAEYNFLQLSEDYQKFDETSVIDTPLETNTYDQDIINLLKASQNNPELTKMYKYIYETKGKDEATNFLNNMKDTINQINGNIKAQEFLNSLDSADNIGIINHLKTLFKGTGDGVESFFNGLGAWFTSSDIYSESDYEIMYILQGLQDEKYQGLNKFLDNNYEISQSIGNMLPSIALSIILTPTAGTISMGVSAGGNSYHNALVEGENINTSVLYGVLSGLSEATLEKYLGAIPGLSEVNVTSVKTFAQSVLKEGIEEGTQEYVDALLKAGLFGSEINIEEVTMNAGKSAIYGAIVGGIMNSPSLAMNNMINKNTIQGELSNYTIENLESIKNKKLFRLQTSDGQIFTYNEIMNYVFANQQQSLLENSPVSGTTLNEVGDNMISFAENRINTIFNNKINAQKFIRGILASPFQLIGRFINLNVSSNLELTNTILKDGIYHFTDIESAQKIIESGYIKSSSNISSYGKKKSFFFAGIPSFEQLIMNINISDIQKAIAVKINVDESKINDLNYRKFCDNAITKYGDFKFNDGDAQIVYLGLVNENGNINYKEISKEQYENYECDIPVGFLTSKLNAIKSIIIAYEQSYDILMKDIDFIKNKISKLSHDTIEKLCNRINELNDETLNYEYNVEVDSVNTEVTANKTWSGIRLSKVDHQQLADIGVSWFNADQENNYISGDNYFDIFKDQADSLFKNSKAYKKIFNQKIYNQNITKILNANLPTGLDGYAAYVYYQKLKQVLIDDNYKSNIKVNVIPRIKNSNIESMAVVWINNEPKIVYSASLGKKNIANFTEYKKLFD